MEHVWWNTFDGTHRPLQKSRHRIIVAHWGIISSRFKGKFNNWPAGSPSGTSPSCLSSLRLPPGTIFYLVDDKETRLMNSHPQAKHAYTCGKPEDYPICEIRYNILHFCYLRFYFPSPGFSHESKRDLKSETTLMSYTSVYFGKTLACSRLNYTLLMRLYPFRDPSATHIFVWQAPLVRFKKLKLQL